MCIFFYSLRKSRIYILISIISKLEKKQCVLCVRESQRDTDNRATVDKTQFKNDSAESRLYRWDSLFTIRKTCSNNVVFHKLILIITRAGAQHVAAPEVQQKKLGSFSSDMYGLGMTICAIYNQGRPLIQANHNPSDYLKQLEIVSVDLCSRYTRAWKNYQRFIHRKKSLLLSLTSLTIKLPLSCRWYRYLSGRRWRDSCIRIPIKGLPLKFWPWSSSSGIRSCTPCSS